MKKLMGWDIEIANPIQNTCPKCKVRGLMNRLDDGMLQCPACEHTSKWWNFGQDWWNYEKLGVTTAGLFTRDSNGKPREKWYLNTDEPDKAMTKQQVNEMMVDMAQFAQQGWQFVTVNGTLFDWQVLYHETGNPLAKDLCKNHHIDLMAHVVWHLGYRASLNKLALGQGFEEKMHTIIRSDGSLYEGNIGMDAPELWKDPTMRGWVILYMMRDCELTYDIAMKVAQQQGMYWKSNAGNPQSIEPLELMTVQQLIDMGQKKDKPLVDCNELIDWL